MSDHAILSDRMCDGKLRHATREAAGKQKAALGYVGLEIYRCRFCHAYHVGHSQRRTPRVPDWKFQRWLAGL